MIRREHAPQNLLPHAQVTKYLGGGERDVEEEADVGAGQLAEEVGGEEKEVVVLYPDRIAGAVLLHDLGGKLRDASRMGNGGSRRRVGEAVSVCQGGWSGWVVRVGGLGGCLVGWLV